MLEKNTIELLSQGLKQLNLADTSLDKLLAFVTLLEKWNKTYNITAIRDVEQMVIYHLLDSATVYRYLNGNSIIDVGTGGGIPGIIFAIINPQLNVTLLDSNQKKTRFLRYAQRQLNLTNITVVCQRVEDYQPQTGFDVVISRAFSEVGQFLQLAGHLCASDGKVLAMKGPRIESEQNSKQIGFRLIEEISLNVPFLDAVRRLLIFKKI
ncbi:MAG TPA: 16S rRNA (guanine(527)-N(7))-methyltransferase RsmG [Oceanospirillales bacterium]|nr:16S rRNA (guanine(527)-N(7))-methyltransferase RsmG [Oceanospirillales bacterium]